ncbi:Ribonuclease H-like superfamily protein [Striga hermonthica]|uniref:Ribonuclease H-like superfamily protein n=1 Tax=Striga hermonthica TaxID=68872 RepID=A0A9N7MS47_STRHE|nr:Ribonuclease H-like superfamily protein [Striga hermonthica]
MDIDVKCCCCTEEDETLEHLMFHYSRAQNVWKLAGLSWECLASKEITFTDWWSQLCCLQDLKHNKNRISLSVYLLWWLWRTRNICIFEKEVIYEQQLVDKAKMEWLEFEDVNYGHLLLKPRIVDSLSYSDENQGIGEQALAASLNGPHSEFSAIKGTTYQANIEVACWTKSTKTMQQKSSDAFLLELRAWLEEGLRLNREKIVLHKLTAKNTDEGSTNPQPPQPRLAVALPGEPSLAVALTGSCPGGPTDSNESHSGLMAFHTAQVWFLPSPGFEPVTLSIRLTRLIWLNVTYHTSHVKKDKAQFEFSLCHTTV